MVCRRLQCNAMQCMDSACPRWKSGLDRLQLQCRTTHMQIMVTQQHICDKVSDIMYCPVAPSTSPVLASTNQYCPVLLTACRRLHALGRSLAAFHTWVYQDALSCPFQRWASEFCKHRQPKQPQSSILHLSRYRFLPIWCRTIEKSNTEIQQPPRIWGTIIKQMLMDYNVSLPRVIPCPNLWTMCKTKMPK